MLPVAGWDIAELSRAWASASPFPHVVLDDVVAPDTLSTLLQAVSQEPHWPNRGEIYDFMASGPTVAHPTLQALHAELGSPPVLEAIRAISGRPVTSADLRSYVYVPGSYLLPHADSRASIGRMVAFAYYLFTEGCEGGELELYACEMAGDELISARSAHVVMPRANRMVLFDVTNASLHQVREVTAGNRVSLTGWFLG
ncbi:MAG: 2OG-Fe(II) oxygenase [Myxococcales bacterium]|nr:2OG-Fe(II) oxygenase [Myxococcales bacterium]